MQTIEAMQTILINATQNIAQKYFYRRDLLNIVQIIYDTFFTSSENFCLFFSSIFELKTRRLM